MSGFKGALALVALAALTACGGGGGGGGSPSATQVTVAGTAAKGLLAFAKVNIYEIGQNIPSATPLATGETNENGSYSLAIVPTSNPILVKIESIAGKTMMLDETQIIKTAAGTSEYKQVPVPAGLELRSIAPNASSGTVSVSVNPFTDAAVAAAETAKDADGKSVAWSADAIAGGIQLANLLVPAGVDPFKTQATKLSQAGTDTAQDNLLVTLTGFMEKARSCRGEPVTQATLEDIKCEQDKLKALTVLTINAGVSNLSNSAELDNYRAAQYAAAKLATKNTPLEDQATKSYYPILPTPVPPANPTPPTADENPPASKLLGANLPAITDYSRTHVFVDLLKQARPFGSPSAPWDGKATVGADGWPVGDFGVFLMTAQAGLTGIDGTYTVTFDGQATVNLTATNGKIQNKSYDPTSNRTRLEVVIPEKSDQLLLVFTNTGAGVKNLKVIRPGYNADNPPIFTNAFLSHIKRFGTLRFMDWLRTNQNTISQWSERADPNLTRTNTGKGVPWEYIVSLANVHEQDIWINIPVSANDDYVMNLARLLKNTLNPRSRIYVEYSNELWNSQFQQFGTNRALAEAEVKADPNSPLAYDGSQDANKWMYRRIAKRGKEISDIFRSVFGDAAMMNRVRPVFATQVVLPYVSELGLKFIEAVYGPPSRYFYAMAGAPYFNLGKQQRVEGLTADDVLKAMEQSVTDLAMSNQFERNQALASWYNLRWMAYEGGADSFGPGSHDAKLAANLDPRMQDLCQRYLSNWYQAGGQLFMWYTAGAGNWTTQYGAWELTTDLAISDTPKIRCMDQTLAGPTPAVEGRNKAPGSFESYAVAGNFPPYTESSINSVRYVRAGGYNDYLVQAEQTGTYQLVLSAAMDSRGNSVDVSVNGANIVSAFPIAGTGWSTVIDQAPMSIYLKKGFNTVRLTTNTTNNGYDLRKLTFIKQ